MGRETRRGRPAGAPSSDERLGGGYVETSLRRYRRRSLASLSSRDRERLLERIAELRFLDRVMRERGTLAEPEVTR